MIRVGSSSTGFTTVLNTFHSQSSETSGFFLNVAGGVDPPPSTITKAFASEVTSAPWLRVGKTIFVDPYGFTSDSTTVSSLYFSIKVKEATSIGLSWSNAYSGTSQKIIPDGSIVESIYTEIDDLVYLRVRNSTNPYRFFVYYNGEGEHVAVLVGPENIDKLTPQQGSSFYLSVLEGLPAALIFFTIAAGPASVVVSKDETSLSLGAFSSSLFTEFPLSGTSARRIATCTFWIVQ